GHSRAVDQCPLSGVKRTWRLHCEMAAYDPRRTLRDRRPVADHHRCSDYWVEYHTLSNMPCAGHRSVIEKNVNGTARFLSYKNLPRPECTGLYEGPWIKAAGGQRCRMREALLLSDH